jgi:glycosyltransferase involved in cell wall biosynthesis
MKIAVNTRFLLKNQLEGVGMFTHEVLRRLVAQHPEDEFVFFFDRHFHPAFIFGKNVTPVVLFPPARHPFLFVWWYEWSLARALAKYKPDVLLSPDNFLSLRTNVKTVLVTHDLAHAAFPEQLTFFQRLYHRYFLPKFNRKAEKIIAVSEFTKTDIVKRYDIRPEKIAVACNGCRVSFIPLTEGEKKWVRDKYAAGQPYFFYLGAVHPRKNVHRLIGAFDLFKQRTGSPAKLLIAGRFAWKAGEVLQAYQRANNQQDIRFLGYVQEDELPKLMGGAHALTYVSLFEGFGVPILEAMHCEVPVITSNVTSLPEVAGNAGLLADPNSEEEIAYAMQQVWENEHLCQKLVEEGKKQRQLFSWEKATEIVYECLSNIVNTSKLTAY